MDKHRGVSSATLRQDSSALLRDSYSAPAHGPWLTRLRCIAKRLFRRGDDGTADDIGYGAYSISYRTAPWPLQRSFAGSKPASHARIFAAQLSAGMLLEAWHAAPCGATENGRSAEQDVWSNSGRLPVPKHCHMTHHSSLSGGAEAGRMADSAALEREAGQG